MGMALFSALGISNKQNRLKDKNSWSHSAYLHSSKEEKAEKKQISENAKYFP